MDGQFAMSIYDGGMEAGGFIHVSPGKQGSLEIRRTVSTSDLDERF